MSTRSFASRCVAAPAAALLLFQISGCDRTTDRTDGELTTVRQSTPALSDEELFREIVFPNATSAAKVPELGRVYDALRLDLLDDSQREAFSTFQGLIVDQIVDNDPEFMAQFAEDVTSGDPLRVEAALQSTRGVVIDAASALSDDLQVLTSAGSIDELELRINNELGPNADLLEHIEGMDPSDLHDMLETLHEHLLQHDIPHDPSMGSQHGIATMVDLATNVDSSSTTQEAHGALWLTHDIAVYTWGVAAVAVVAVVAAVAVVAVVGGVIIPFQGAETINGESAALFHDQLIANIAGVYAA